MNATPAQTDIRIRFALEGMTLRDSHFQSAVDTALAFAGAYHGDWRAVARTIAQAERHIEGGFKVSLPFTAVRVTIESYVQSQENIDLEVDELDREIARRDSVDLSSAWCGEQDHFGEVTDHLRQQRDDLKAGRS